MKKLLLVALCLALWLPAALAEGGEIKIGILMPQDGGEDAAAAAYWAESRCIEKGVDYLLAACSGPEDALEEIDEMIVWGAQAIVMYPGFDGAEDAAAAAREAEVPVVCVEKLVGGAFLASADDYDAGVQNAYYMAQALEGAGNVLVFDAAGESPAARLLGFRDTLEEIAPNMTILDSAQISLSQSAAFNAAQRAFARYGQVDGVYAADDLIALGVLEAASTLGRDDVTVIVSCGGRQGWLRAMTQQDARTLETVLRIPAVAMEAVDMACDLASGLSVEARRDVGGQVVEAAEARDYLDAENPY